VKATGILGTHFIEQLGRIDVGPCIEPTAHQRPNQRKGVASIDVAFRKLPSLKFTLPFDLRIQDGHGRSIGRSTMALGCMSKGTTLGELGEQPSPERQARQSPRRQIRWSAADGSKRLRALLMTASMRWPPNESFQRCSILDSSGRAADQPRRTLPLSPRLAFLCARVSYCGWHPDCDCLITVDQLQSMEILDVLRVGVFFVAFGTAGRQLMNSFLERFPSNPPPRPG
jgi:hypothetical protein